MLDFTGQNVVVTGGTRGIGRAVVEAFLDRGATVIATYVSHDAGAESLKEQNSGRKERLFVEKFNVADYDAAESFFSSYPERYGDLHVLVNNSGIRRDSILATMKKQDWEEVLAVNLTGAYHMCKFGVQVMMPQRYGRIVNITSPCGRFGFEGQSNYAASKAGLIGMTRSLSKETAKRKITVNCVSPGFVATELIAGLSKELADSYKKQVPLKRFAPPEEIAPAVLFLASKEASYITGETIEVSGGL